MRIMEWCEYCDGITEFNGTRCTRCGKKRPWLRLVTFLLALSLLDPAALFAASTDPGKDLRGPRPALTCPHGQVPWGGRCVKPTQPRKRVACEEVGRG